MRGPGALAASRQNRVLMRTTWPPYDLIAIGPRPPWITGQSLVTDALLRNLRAQWTTD